MDTGEFVGRVGALAVTLGVGTAVAVGWGCGTSAADSPGSTAPSGASAKTSDAGQSLFKKKAAKPVAAAKDAKGGSEPEQRRPLEKFDARVRAAVRDALDAVGLDGPDDHLPSVTNTGNPSGASRLGSRAGKLRELKPGIPSADANPKGPEPRHAVEPKLFDLDRITVVPKSVLSPALKTVPAIVPRRSPQPVDAPASKPDIAGVVVGAISTVVDNILNPSSKNSAPATPAEPPAALALLAFARRELERSFAEPQKLMSSELISQQAATPIGLAPGIVVPPELDGHVIVTDPPSLTDRLTVFAMEALGGISKVIGVSIVSKLGEAILSPEPPWFTTIGLDVQKDTYEGGDVWIITPPNPTGEKVIAIHGSGFIYAPNIIHWLDYTQMARQTGATVIVPRYPLIPDGGTAANTIPPMADFIAQMVETTDGGAENVSVYADSAGGTVAILAVQKIVRDCNGDTVCLAQRVPSRMVLVSGGVSGPDIYTDPNVVLVNDPVSGIPDPDAFAPWQNSAPEILWNTMLGPTEDLPVLTLYIGTREIGSPGTLLYVQRLLQENPDADVTVVIGMGQIHDWAQGGGIPINSQTGKYRDDVYRQLGIVGDESMA